MSSPSAASPLSGSVRLLLIRHGESEFNLSPHLIGGQTNSAALTLKGQFQAKRLGIRLANEAIQFDEIYSSTAVRAFETARISLSECSHWRSVHRPSQPLIIPPVVQREEFLEQSQGDWEGQERAKVYTPARIAEMAQSHIRFQPPNGESLQMVQDRAIKVLQPAIEQGKTKSITLKRPYSIGLYAHGGTIRTLLQHYLGLEERFTWLLHQDNTAINEILFDARGIAGVRINDAAHWKMQWNEEMEAVEKEWKEKEKKKQEASPAPSP
jgi:broad specificity phosphatase PhoE